MKRKTNLFYTTGPDSKFITFSNYTESLTGNFLSTDTKIFPSRFIALYIKGLNKNTKGALIKYIADYYESKLAVLRDHFDYNKSDIEKSVPPLNYLLEALLRIKEINESMPRLDVQMKHRLATGSGGISELKKGRIPTAIPKSQVKERKKENDIGFSQSKGLGIISLSPDRTA